MVSTSPLHATLKAATAFRMVAFHRRPRRWVVEDSRRSREASPRVRIAGAAATLSRTGSKRRI